MDAILCGAQDCQRPAQSDIGPYCTYHLEHPPASEANAPGAISEVHSRLDRDTVVWLALATRSDLEQEDATAQMRALANEVLSLRDARDQAEARLAALTQPPSDAEGERVALLRRAFDAMVLVLPSGQPCYRTENGIPQGMPRRVERLARAALAAGREG